MRIISPSILSSDFGQLKQEIEMLDKSAAQWVHIDVMDGTFVPNISFGFPILESVRKYTSMQLDVHLMIVNPEKYVERFVKSGADLVSFHIEATDKHLEIIELIKKCGAKAGIAIKPNTPESAIESLLPLLDLVVIMSVEPGFGGQKFDERAIERTRTIRTMIEACGSKAVIEVDGGINDKNAAMLFEAGADALVAGSSVFSAQDPLEAINKLINA